MCFRICNQNLRGSPISITSFQDGFANSRTLQEIWGYDNSDFIRFLRSRGFYVVERAASNYDRTYFSVTSTMKMQYLDRIYRYVGNKIERQTVYERMLQTNYVISVFKQLGYKIINVSSGSGGTDWMLEADETVRCTPINHFTLALLLLTPLRTVDRYVPLLRDALAEVSLCPSRHLKRLIDLPGPKFVLLHTLLSHQPFLFRDDGSRLPLDPALHCASGTPEMYVGQLRFAQKQLESWVDLIHSKPGMKPIIIIQSDHGPNLPMAMRALVNERMRILSAYYFPAVNNRGLYESMTPVNTFRVLLNDYFHTDLPLLPDHSFYARKIHSIDLGDFENADRYLHF